MILKRNGKFFHVFPTGLLHDIWHLSLNLLVISEFFGTFKFQHCQGIMWGLYRAFNWVTGHQSTSSSWTSSKLEVSTWSKKNNPTETWKTSKLCVPHCFHIFLLLCLYREFRGNSLRKQRFLTSTFHNASFLLQDLSQSTLLHLGEYEASQKIHWKWLNWLQGKVSRFPHFPLLGG